MHSYFKNQVDYLAEDKKSRRLVLPRILQIIYMLKNYKFVLSLCTKLANFNALFSRIHTPRRLKSDITFYQHYYHLRKLIGPRSLARGDEH